MKRILFVDSDPKIINSARDLLKGLVVKNEIVFTDNGEKALAILSKDKFDIIVTDIQLPGMNGAELLSYVQKFYPKTVRLVLSKPANIDLLRRTAGLAHQYINKPFMGEEFISSILRAFSFGDLLSDEKLQKLILSIQSLPSLPSLYLEIVDELQGPNPSSDKVAEIIARDISMSAKVLQLVNSAFFGLPRLVSSPAQATVMLGLETIRDIVLSLQLFSQFDHNLLRRLEITYLWDHSLSVGLISKKIAKTITTNREIIDAAFLAGLLHDLGKLVLAENFAMKYYSAIRIATRKKINIYDAEQEVFGTNHAYIGAYLIGIWGLPDLVVEATGFHHNIEFLTTSGISLAPIVHVADIFDLELHPERVKGMIPQMDVFSLAKLGYSESLESWRQKVT